jgi:hypothetical protein
MLSQHTQARAHSGPGGIINPMEQTMNLNVPRVDGGDLLSDVEFDRLIAAKFPPVRRRCDVIDFPPTVQVDYSAHTSECHEDEDSEFGALEGAVRGRRYIALSWLIIAVIGAAVWVML